MGIVLSLLNRKDANSISQQKNIIPMPIYNNCEVNFNPHQQQHNYYNMKTTTESYCHPTTSYSDNFYYRPNHSYYPNQQHMYVVKKGDIYYNECLFPFSNPFHMNEMLSEKLSANNTTTTAIINNTSATSGLTKVSSMNTYSTSCAYNTATTTTTKSIMIPKASVAVATGTATVITAAPLQRDMPSIQSENMISNNRKMNRCYQWRNPTLPPRQYNNNITTTRPNVANLLESIKTYVQEVALNWHWNSGYANDSYHHQDDYYHHRQPHYYYQQQHSRNSHKYSSYGNRVNNNKNNCAATTGSEPAMTVPKSVSTTISDKCTAYTGTTAASTSRTNSNNTATSACNGIVGVTLPHQTKNDSFPRNLSPKTSYSTCMVFSGSPSTDSHHHHHLDDYDSAGDDSPLSEPSTCCDRRSSDEGDLQPEDTISEDLSDLSELSLPDIEKIENLDEIDICFTTTTTTTMTMTTTTPTATQVGLCVVCGTADHNCNGCCNNKVSRFNALPQEIVAISILESEADEYSTDESDDDLSCNEDDSDEDGEEDSDDDLQCDCAPPETYWQTLFVKAGTDSESDNDDDEDDWSDDSDLEVDGPCESIHIHHHPCSLLAIHCNNKDFKDSCDNFTDLFSTPATKDKLTVDDVANENDQDISSLVQKANEVWNRAYADQNEHSSVKTEDQENKESDKSKKVHFASSKNLLTTHYMVVWSYAYQAARVSPWGHIRADIDRFQRRIKETEPTLNLILDPIHRQKIFTALQKMDSND